MARSIKKGFYVPHYLKRKVKKAQEEKNPKPIETYARNATIIPDFVGQTFKVHNGRSMSPVYITEEMIGHKTGEFAPTRTFRGHTNKTKKNK